MITSTFFFLLFANLNAETAMPETRYLWPEGAPGAKGDEGKDKPKLDIYLPPEGAANGAAVVVCPGGGYGGLALGHEGDEIAKFLNGFGVSAFVLHYRLGSHGYHHPVQLGDAQRAIRTVRSDASKYGITPDRIGIMGFSAGGHLASTAGTHFDAGQPESEDPIEKVGCRPDFLILCYPVVSFTTQYTHRGSLRNLLGKQESDQELVKNLSNELQVTNETPPTFLFHTNEDRGVPPENSVLFYMALRKAGVPAEMHIYQKGGHGIGLTKGGEVNATWGNRLKGWMQVNGWLAKP